VCVCVSIHDNYIVQMAGGCVYELAGL